jgi:hypothetical protein
VILASLSGTIAAWATAVGVLFAAIALLLQRSQARTQFEDSLVDEYRQLIKPDLVGDVLLQDVFAELPQVKREHVQRMYLYFDLCNEQVFLRATGRVSRPTWVIQWGPGIKQNLDYAKIAEAWKLIQEKTCDFRELRAFSRDWADPRTWEPPWRRLPVRLGMASLRVPDAARGECKESL